MNKLFTTNFSVNPYWHDESPLVELPLIKLSESTDVVVIGAGYTGLHAALVMARSGRQVVIVDAEQPGWGCSGRNGGQVSGSIKPTVGQLSSAHGKKKAMAMVSEGHHAVEWLQRFIEMENLSCNFQRCGSFLGAHTKRHFDRLRREIENEPAELLRGAEVVSATEMHRELGTDVYFGGAVYPRDASIQPAQYHQGLLGKVLEAGVSVHPLCKVEGIQTGKNLHRVHTSQGGINAREVVIATNGYTGSATPWARRRIIPIGSYMITTEPIKADVMNNIMPTNRVICDTRKVVYYYRPSPDRTRVVFGGRVSAHEEDPKLSAPKLHSEMCKLFPQLTQTRISHSWMGFVAFTFDSMAHIGVHQGIHYAMGYCGSGIALSSYFGHQIGRQVLGCPTGQTEFNSVLFRTRPLYTGHPWFLGAAVKYHQCRDKLGV